MYEPKINDYVKWNTKQNLEGWIYFKSQSYVTIEILVRPKSKQNYQDCCLHKKERLLVLCYRQNWKELEYVKSRSGIHES